MSAFFKNFKAILPEKIKQQIDYIGWKRMLLYFFIQRIIGINRNIPWPVHWASIVTHHQKIIRKSVRPYPGFMPGQYIQAINGIIIGKNVRMGPGVKLISANHDIYNFDVHVPAPPIQIGDNCWLGANAVILPGVTLGNHVIVGANAVVTQNFPNNCVIAGIPAKIIKYIDEYKENADVNREDSTI